jgi:hypothetical protein
MFSPAEYPLVNTGSSPSFGNLTISSGTVTNVTVSGNLVIQGSANFTGSAKANGSSIPKIGQAIVNAIIFG